MPARSPSRLLRLIALFKLFKALVLLTSLATAFNLLQQDDPAHRVITWALALHVDPDNRYLRVGLAALLHLDPQQFALLAVGTALYAVLFSAEGIGLWFGKVWAEYLTIVATAGVIPIELYEVIMSSSAPKTVTLALNVFIVIYLVTQVRHAGGTPSVP